MKKITSEDLIELLITPMTDIKMIETLAALNIEQPVIDEKYEIELSVDVLDSENSGVTLSFKEIDGHTSDGEPCLTYLSFKNENKMPLPFELKEDDDYKTCCEKLGSIADYINPNIEEAKIWLKETSSGEKYTLAINFWDEDLEELASVVIVKFDESRLGDTLLENKE